MTENDDDLTRWRCVQGSWFRVVVDANGEPHYGLRIEEMGDASFGIAVGQCLPGSGLMDMRGHGTARSLDDALGLADELVLQVMLQDKWRADLGL